ncbi:MAG: substrate-binding domain-containing protein [Thermodesulfobacteriota bacterium]
MKERRTLCCRRIIFLALLLGAAWLFTSPAAAQDLPPRPLKFACSAQVHEVIRDDILKLFTDKTGVKMEADLYSSSLAVSRLAYDLADVAATALRLDTRSKAEGLLEFPICKDALVIFTNPEMKVTDLTDKQIRDIFSGAITNWNQCGGPDRAFMLVIPTKDSALYQNFARMFMEGKDTVFDVMTARSTMVVDVARRFAGALSFVNLAATRGKPEGAKLVKVNGLGPDSPQYPYYQVFSLVTKGKPVGDAKKFLDFMMSEEVTKLLEARGVKRHKE